MLQPDPYPFRVACVWPPYLLFGEQDVMASLCSVCIMNCGFFLFSAVAGHPTIFCDL